MELVNFSFDSQNVSTSYERKLYLNVSSYILTGGPEGNGKISVSASQQPLGVSLGEGSVP